MASTVHRQLQSISSSIQKKLQFKEYSNIDKNGEVKGGLKASYSNVGAKVTIDKNVEERWPLVYIAFRARADVQ